MKKYLLFLSLSLLFSAQLFGQGQTYNWCFGDSCYLKYTGGVMTPQPYSITLSIEANASISDKNGNLLFYVGDTSLYFGWVGQVVNRNHLVMPHGDSIFMYESSTNGAMIVPFPGDSSKYYIFSNYLSMDTAYRYFLYYSVVDLSADGGLGDVVQKNVLLLNSKMCEKLALVRHGNGKDWWLLTHLTTGDFFYNFLIDSTGINAPLIQSIGTSYDLNWNSYLGLGGEMIFSDDGSKLAAVGFEIIDYFQFDRCTGLLSNYQKLSPDIFSYPDDEFYGCSFSPKTTALYVSNVCSKTNEGFFNTNGNLLQFDLTATDIRASRQLIFTMYNSDIAIGQHQIAPDGKIYIIMGHNGFPNNTFDSASMHLSTIENPDAIGSACNFHHNSFYLGGHHAFFGLPNMPNYNLGALMGSSCDTVSGIKSATNQKAIIEIYPNPATTTINIECDSKQNLNLSIFNIVGECLLQRDFSSSKEEINISNLPSGLYFIRLNNPEGSVVKKFVKE